MAAVVLSGQFAHAVDVAMANQLWCCLALAAVPILSMLWNWLGPNGVRLTLASPSYSLSYFFPTQLRQVPTVGTSVPILAYLNGIRYMKHAREMLLYGYAKVCA